MKISLIQMNSTDNRDRNLELCGTYIEQAVSEGADLITLPETFDWIGSEHEKPGHSTPIPGPVSEFLSSCASKHGVSIHGGSMIETVENSNRCANTSLFFGPDGKQLALYRKIHLFDAQINGRKYRESASVVPGNEPAAAALQGLTYGLTICYDLRFPELFRKLVQLGAVVIFCPAAFTQPTGKAHWEILLRARAIENQVFMAAAAQTGTDVTGKTYYGNSMVVDPWGNVLLRMDGRTEGCRSVDIHIDTIEKVRRMLPALDHRRL